MEEGDHLLPYHRGARAVQRAAAPGRDACLPDAIDVRLALRGLVVGEVVTRRSRQPQGLRQGARHLLAEHRSLRAVSAASAAGGETWLNAAAAPFRYEPLPPRTSVDARRRGASSTY